MRRECTAWEYNWATLFLGDINIETWPHSSRGVSNLRQQNLVKNAAGFGPENDCRGEGQQQLKTTEASSHERG
jgi:hypothetical protein